MINSQEIEEKALEFEIHSSNVQRDYVFGWILFGIFTKSALKDRIFLKGGNALRKGYFADTRFSKDLDFGIPDDIPQEDLLNEINKVCEIIGDQAGINFVNQDNCIKEKFVASEAPLPDLRVYEVRVYFKDFHGQADHLRIKISMDVTRFDKVLLPIQEVRLIHDYSDAEEVSCLIRCVKLEEIIATKLKCLVQRQHAPDLFDYAYSIKLLGGDLDKKEVVKTLIKKTIFSRNPYTLKGILLSTAFGFFREEWSTAIICAKKFLMNVEDAIKLLTEDMEVLFSDYSNNGFAEFVYFGPDVRSKIMKAGRTQTLLNIRYKGYDRIVEPYSLKYLQKKDGQEREYFYIYNRQGGTNSPGVRSLLPYPLEWIENTDDKFDPRFQIELSQAGELPENPYLFDPNRPARKKIPRSSRKKSSPGIRYIYKCVACGKESKKVKNDSRMRAHKNKYGRPCSGTYGYYVGTKW